MKILTIPDLHGKSVWNECCKHFINDVDKIIFLGDYVDDYWPTTDEQILTNLQEIIQFKKDNLEKVELLYGNHEQHYLYDYATHGCSGYRSSMYINLHILLDENKHLFNTAYQINNFIWSHAGISSAWYKRFLQIAPLDLEGNLACKINTVAKSSKEWIISEVGSIRGGLRDSVGGPLWADAQETTQYPLSNFIQIVGHTPHEKVTTFQGDDFTYFYCDVFNKKSEVLLLNINDDGIYFPTIHLCTPTAK